jgi:hypothetical protein
MIESQVEEQGVSWTKGQGTYVYSTLPCFPQNIKRERVDEDRGKRQVWWSSIFKS